MRSSPCNKYDVPKKEHIMNNIFTNTIKTLALGLILAASVHSAQADVVAHTYVSGVGSDSNPCSRTAPCATFAGALTNTLPGGVITALDAGDYGSVTIAQAVTIDGTGAQASIVTGSNVPAITINGGPTDTIILRHLAITGVSTGIGVSGVRLTTGNLVMDDCKVSGFLGLFGSGLNLNGSGNSVVENTTMIGCSLGIFNNNSGLLSLRNVTLQGNQDGLLVEAGLTDISHSLITQNSGYGLFANGSTVSASDCMISGNGTAVEASTNGIIRLTNNDILNNTTGIYTTGGGIVSTTGDNRKAGNGTSGAPTPGRVIVQQ